MLAALCLPQYCINTRHIKHNIHTDTCTKNIHILSRVIRKMWHCLSCKVPVFYSTRGVISSIILLFMPKHKKNKKSENLLTKLRKNFKYVYLFLLLDI